MRFRSSPALASLALAAAATVLPAGAQPRETLTPWGRAAVAVPESTSRGSWDGSWIHKSRDHQMAFFARTVDGKTQIKVHFQSLSNAEAFESDWTGKATYYLSGFPATFEMKILEAGSDEIRGTWERSVDFSDSGKSETGRFRIYRSGAGRNLVVLFETWEKITRRFGDVSRWDNPPLWTFMKVSRRVVLWDELPF